MTTWAAIAAKPAIKPVEAKVEVPAKVPALEPNSKALIAATQDLCREFHELSSELKHLRTEHKMYAESCIPVMEKRYKEAREREQTINAIVERMETAEASPEYKALVKELCELSKQYGLACEYCDHHHAGTATVGHLRNSGTWAAEQRYAELQKALFGYEQRYHAELQAFYKEIGLAFDAGVPDFALETSKAELQLSLNRGKVVKLQKQIAAAEAKLEKLRPLQAAQVTALRVLQLDVPSGPKAEQLVQIPLAHLEVMFELLQL